INSCPSHLSQSGWICKKLFVDEFQAEIGIPLKERLPAEEALPSLGMRSIDQKWTGTVGTICLHGTIGTNGEICLAPLKVENLKMHSSSLLGINNHCKQSPLHEIRNAASMTLSCGTTSSRRSSLHLRGGPLARKDIFYSGNIPQNSSNLYMYDVQEDEEQEVGDASTKSRIINCLCPPVMIEAFKEMMNFKLMTNVIFLMFGLSNFFTNIGFNVPYVYTKDRAIGLNIANETYASFLISIIGIANTVGRVVLGYLSDRSFINRLWLYNGSLALCGFATAFSSFCLTYEWMAVYAAVFGATSGRFQSIFFKNIQYSLPTTKSPYSEFLPITKIFNRNVK
ncbi:hypothetical protein AVEN_61537-1, partial [Araneus ventricosus]